MLRRRLADCFSAVYTSRFADSFTEFGRNFRFIRGIALGRMHATLIGADSA